MSRRTQSEQCDPNGIFHGMVVYAVGTFVNPRRLEIWKQKLVQMGANIKDHFSKDVTHVLASDHEALIQQIESRCLLRFKGRVLRYQWLEDSLKSGRKLPEDSYCIPWLPEVEAPRDKPGSESFCPPKKPRFSADSEANKIRPRDHYSQLSNSRCGSDESFSSTKTIVASSPSKDLPSLYQPPHLNRNITQIFDKLVGIYKALGDDRRSFSYYKAISVIEKVPFKIEFADQVKDFPGIGKSMRDHIQEIVSTGKLAKLEHFESDGKVRTISLFGEVWGIGPATALKLYDKGYRNLRDLKDEPSLTHSQKIGLQYFDDIKTRIPRHEVAIMEKLLQDAGQALLPEVCIVCGGSYRRGKSSCGDIDVVITHPDGQSHKGFLPKFVKLLKDRKFLREDLMLSTHSEEGTDSGVDSYFGLCTFPGREVRHRIDMKVYPKEIHAFGLIAWTGNDVLNRRLRLAADWKGYKLDDTGLYPSSGGKRVSRISLSPCVPPNRKLPFRDPPL